MSAREKEISDGREVSKDLYNDDYVVLARDVNNASKSLHFLLSKSSFLRN